jgi:hypothetical protein
MKNSKLIITSFIAVIFISTALAQRPYRVGTTAANFLEIGFGCAGISMGDAYVSMVQDVSAIYWNPGGLAFMSQNEAQFVHQPWIVDIYTSFAAAGIKIPAVGTLALGLVYTGYGDMEVTTVAMQDGTGEQFTANDYAVSLAFARDLTNWFSFGVTGKYVASKIWHMNASAMAVDLGVIVKTPFFSQSGSREDGMRLGMSISNYGTRMQYDGIDLINPIDILPSEDGNYKDAPGQFRPGEWELPLIFRVGVGFKYRILENHKIILAMDALHPNNDAEYVNVGTEYELNVPTFGKLFLRGGYKGFFLPDSEFGLTFGIGLEKHFLNNLGLKVDYAYREVGILGNVESFSIGFLF